MPGGAPAEALHLASQPARLPDQRGHPHALESAGDDPLERLQVVLDVDGEPVCGHAASDVYADRRDLALANPDAGVVRTVLGPGSGDDALVGQRCGERVLERSY